MSESRLNHPLNSWCQAFVQVLKCWEQVDDLDDWESGLRPKLKADVRTDRMSNQDESQWSRSEASSSLHLFMLIH